MDAIDTLARERRTSRARIVAMAVEQWAAEHDVIDRLVRIEHLLRSGGVVTAAPAAEPARPKGETDADRSLALLRSWGNRDDDD